MSTAAKAKKSKKSTTADQKYDAACKKFLSNKEILALILQNCVPEYAECSLTEIVGYITAVDAPGEVPLDDIGAEQIIGLANEANSTNEGLITYDVRFKAKAPAGDGTTELILNIEAQNNSKPGYSLPKRAAYYVSRLISSQKGTIFQHSDYNEIRKVYSIWLLTSPPKSKQGFINHYKVSEFKVLGNRSYPSKSYEDFNFILVGLGDVNSTNHLVKALSGYFSDDTNKAEKLAYLQNAGVQTIKYEQEVHEMCNLSEGVKAHGKAELIYQFMSNSSITFEEAVSQLGIPPEEAEIYRPLVEKLANDNAQ